MEKVWDIVLGVAIGYTAIGLLDALSWLAKQFQ